MAAANHELARSDYLAGMKYKDIADKYGVSINTVKSWAKRHNWTRPKRVQPATKKQMQPKEGAKSQKRVAAAMIASVEENEELSDQEREFCLRYIRTFNATRSYMDAFSSSWESANAHAWRLMQKQRIRDEIRRLKEIKNSAILASGEDVVEMYMRIAFADLKDFVDWGRTTVPVMGPFGPITVDDGCGGKIELHKEVNDVRFADSKFTDGQMVNEIKLGRDGASIKLADRMKALEWLSDYFELNPKDRPHEVEERRARIEKLKAETARIKGENPDDDIQDDGFMEALQNGVDNIWDK